MISRYPTVTAQSGRLMLEKKQKEKLVAIKNEVMNSSLFFCFRCEPVKVESSRSARSSQWRRDRSNSNNSSSRNSSNNSSNSNSKIRQLLARDKRRARPRVRKAVRLKAKLKVNIIKMRLQSQLPLRRPVRWKRECFSPGCTSRNFTSASVFSSRGISSSGT